jgi:excisionase family DNA binding protein
MAINKKEAAKRLGVSEKTVDRQIACGNLSYHRIGRRILFDEQDLADYWTLCRRPSLREMQQQAGAARQHLREAALQGATNEPAT